MKAEINEFMESLKQRTPGEKEFHQAVQEVAESVWDFYMQNPKYRKNKILERMCEPERTIIFRVPWVDDHGEVQINRGYRVEFNSAIGPYKGGIRFHATVTLSILKFLGFEQTFKNSLTTLPMGGGKGGSDFSPKGKSDGEIMRFCQSFMNELFRHIGPDTDVPAGDIGVGGREVGYMFGQYKRLRNEFTGVFTGKGIGWGGSLIRPEATGFGAVYFVRHMLKRLGKDIAGHTFAISGFGNVAWGAVSKINELGGKVVTISGPDGYVYDPDGISGDKINYMLELRASNQDIVEPYSKKFGVKFVPGKKPWVEKCDIAIPCATQNELNVDDAADLVKNGCWLVAEASNMGCTAEAVEYLKEHIDFAPGKAVNAGGVSVSGLEMTQNSMRYNWSREEVDQRLQIIMQDIHETCVKFGSGGKRIDYVKGANIGGFVKVAEAMLAQGIV
ncbi:MAG: NADP-specific glutamate dehydrogenase [Prolixibacteraceae bacterium]|jgi:glutamate dehydrogenase (NADP+)|nr:NADP-specific glutamate dehydrogenase [Prolixibacteraceae bacterium]MDI9563921.1 NADP-specific glutamate dehydrogenase [Bacteroidota bacterium]NLS98421.1 NADP-specific glutamate dehydrogenase [Bacteroidales bacterium]OQB82242.1 MAG: NAD-specific glutamate dehydrogenase [Bacteroidetes bacterium ADurb.Bin123]HNZ69493.1 NADP-specific glutamate dehydrogenase [Prolixibacteraceae bacterium]